MIVSKLDVSVENVIASVIVSCVRSKVARYCCGKMHKNMLNTSATDQYIFLMTIGVQKVPIQWERESYDVREKYLDLHPEYRNYSTGSRALHEEHVNIDQVLKFIHGVNYRTCKK